MEVKKGQRRGCCCGTSWCAALRCSVQEWRMTSAHWRGDLAAHRRESGGKCAENGGDDGDDGAGVAQKGLLLWWHLKPESFEWRAGEGWEVRNPVVAHGKMQAPPHGVHAEWDGEMWVRVKKRTTRSREKKRERENEAEERSQETCAEALTMLQYYGPNLQLAEENKRQAKTIEEMGMKIRVAKQMVNNTRTNLKRAKLILMGKCAAESQLMKEIQRVEESMRNNSISRSQNKTEDDLKRVIDCLSTESQQMTQELSHPTGKIDKIKLSIVEMRLKELQDFATSIETNPKNFSN